MERARLSSLQTLFNRWKQLDHRADLIGRKHDDCELSAGQILLITKPLIRRDQYIELSLRTTKQFAVLDAGPSHVLNCTNGEMAETSLNDVGN